MDFLMLAAGAVGMGVTVLAFLGAKHGVPYVWNMVKTWWTSAKTDLVNLKGDIALAHAKIAALEADVATLKAPKSAA